MNRIPYAGAAIGSIAASVIVATLMVPAIASADEQASAPNTSPKAAAPALPPALSGTPPTAPLPASPAPAASPAGALAAASPAAVNIPSLFSDAWFAGVAFGTQVEGGVSLNPSRSADGLNTGQLTTDHANQFQLNQAELTLQRATNPKATDYDFGFALELMYGSDVRFYHFIGELDQAIDTRYQLGVIQANVSAHLPWLSSGGVDVKLGQFPTPLGAETVNPSPLYSHSYIYSYGLPFLNTGLVATAHVTGTLDLWGGVVSGNQTTLGANTGDNNGAPAGVFGFGLNNLMDGRLTVLALSQVGAENPSRIDPGANGALRYYNDLVLTFQATKSLTFTTEGNYVRDDYARAEGYGAAQYAAYTLSDHLALTGRAELWRDNNGFFVARYPGDLDAINVIEGRPNTAVTLPRATYSEFTLGLAYKPSLPKAVSLLMIRPELRWDQTLDGARPYNEGRASSYFTAAVDVVVGF